MQLISRQKVERRRWKRHWINAPIRVLTDSAVIDGRGIRLSEGGVYLFALANLVPGEQIKVEYAAPASGEQLSRSGIVRNRAIYLYGIEFLSDEEQERVSLSLQPIKSRFMNCAPQSQSSREN
jgi:hypothetical protein